MKGTVVMYIPAASKLQTPEHLHDYTHTCPQHCTSSRLSTQHTAVHTPKTSECTHTYGKMLARKS